MMPFGAKQRETAENAIKQLEQRVLISVSNQILEAQKLNQKKYDEELTIKLEALFKQFENQTRKLVIKIIKEEFENVQNN